MEIGGYWFCNKCQSYVIHGKQISDKLNYIWFEHMMNISLVEVLLSDSQRYIDIWIDNTFDGWNKLIW